MVFCVGLSTNAAAAPGPQARVLNESSAGFTLRISVPEPVRAPRDLPDGRRWLEVRIPGFLPGGSAKSGHPDLPQKGFPFGLPEDATARISRVRILTSESFRDLPPLPVPHRKFVRGEFVPGYEETFAPDPRIYASTSRSPAVEVELGPVMGWRHQRIQTLILHPVQAIPATGVYQVIRELEVEIRFDIHPRAPGARPRIPVPVDAPGWDQNIDRTLVNPNTARSFRSRPAAPMLQATFHPGETHLRVRFGTSGLARIPYADLSTAGWPDGTPLARVRVEERGYNQALTNPFTAANIPRKLEDTNGNDIFDSGDFLIFYGFNYQDRFNPLLADGRYSFFHCYWVTDAAGGGVAYPVVDGFPAGIDYVPATSFPHRLHEEENKLYTNSPKDSGFGIFPIYDALYWLSSRETNVDLFFTVTDHAPTGNVQVSARWQGKDKVLATREHFVSLDLNGTTILDQAQFFERFPFLHVGDPMPSAGMILDGNNTLTVRGRTANPAINASGAWFDWFEITYDRLLNARADLLEFNTGSMTGKLEFAVTGFTSPDVLMLEITDPENPVELAAQVDAVGATYTARLRVEVTGGPRRFVAAVPASVSPLPPSRHSLPPDLGTGLIDQGLTRDLLMDGDGSDYILITHPNFEAAWAPLVAHREAQGHRVLLANVWEIYDQFAGGDKTPWAIQRFLTQAFRTWTEAPSFLLLGGDGSEDYRNETLTSDPDWVPTLMHFASVTGVAGLELAGTDTWYAAFLREGDSQFDVMPEMNVGRLPVGTVQETQDMVQKILDYENMDPADDWRNRGFFFADDQYSSRILQTANYCFQPPELLFRTTTEAVCDSIRIQGGHTSFECEIFFLNAVLDSVPALFRNPSDPNDCPDDPNNPFGEMLTPTRTYTRANVTADVISRLNRGHLIWEFTGHANKNLITHEATLENRPGLSVRDMRDILNFGKPFLFMGYACHLAEFEGNREAEVGQSIGEELLLAPNRGAIGVMASTGYEWLSTNPAAQLRTSRALFWDYPRDANGRPRRLFGEAMTQAFASLAAEDPIGLFREMIRTYQTFADPALRIDFLPPAFSVSVNGNVWSDGTEIGAASFSDSVRVEAVLSDDVDLLSIRVMDGPAELPPGRITVTPPDSTDEGSRSYGLSFQTAIRLGTYDVAIIATDWAGRTSSFTLPVRFNTTFLSDGVVLDAGGGALVDPEANVDIEIESPVPLTAPQMEVLVDGFLTTVVPVEQGTPNEWRLLVPGPWSGGTHTIELQVSDPVGGQVNRSLTFASSDPSGELTLQNVYFYPNPTEGGEGSLIYTLNRRAQNARVSIYTVSGRRVLKRDVSSLAGRNAFRWDLRDDRGDEVANGVYLMVLRFDGGPAGTVTTESRPERVVVTR